MSATSIAASLRVSLMERPHSKRRHPTTTRLQTPSQEKPIASEERPGCIIEEKLSLPDVAGEHGVAGVPGLLANSPSSDPRWGGLVARATRKFLKGRRLQTNNDAIRKSPWQRSLQNCRVEPGPPKGVS